ncbi:MAG: hypothetical protein ABJF01_17960 [bacterium]
MNRLTHRARLAIAGVVCAAPLFAGACAFKDQLLQPQQPQIILPEDVSGVSGAEALYLGALGRLKSWSVGGNVNQESLWPMLSLMTDEYKSSDTFSQRNETDQRSVQTNDALVLSVYTQAQQARGYTQDAINSLLKSEPTATGKIGEMYFALGFAEMQLAEDFCNGLPFGLTLDGVPSYTAPLSSADAMKVAIVHLDSAINMASGTDAISVNAKNAALIAKGRAQVFLGQWAAAATTVASVATSYQYVLTFLAGSTSDANGFWIMTTNSQRYSVGDSVDASGQITNAIPFASAKDPRVPAANGASLSPVLKPFDAQTLPYFVQQMFGRNDPIALVDGLDARLVEAEAKLQVADYAGMMTILNALRTSPPQQGTFKPVALAAIATTPATKDAATSLFFREKAFWTFSRGQRFGDLRRLVRQYNRTGNQVWPSGTFHKGGVYGPDVNWPVTDNEKTNPNFTGCTDRNA